MKLVRRFILVGIFIMLVALLAGCAQTAEPAAQTIQSIRVVMDNNYPPYVFQNSDGNLQGILIDQWKLWEEKTGVKVEITALPWGQALASMQAGEYDVIDTIFFNAERANIFDFTEPYADIDVRIFFNKNISGLAQASDLKGFRVAVKTGDANADYLVEKGITDLVYYDSYADIVEAATSNDEAVFVMDQPPALYYLYKYKAQDDFRYSEPLYGGQFHRAVLKGNTEILTIVEDGFSKISPAEYGTINERWFGISHSEEILKFAPYLWAGLIAGAIAILVLFVFNQLLRNRVHHQTKELQATLTELKTSEANLRETELIFSSFLEHSPIYVFFKDKEIRSIRLSKNYEQMLGMPVKEALGKTMNDLFPSELAKSMVEDDIRILNSGTEFNIVEELNGHIYETTKFPVYIDGKPEILAGFTMDITERKNVEESLRESEENYRNLVELSPDAIIVHRDGNIVFANTSSVQLIHARNESDILGKPTLSFVHPDSRSTVRDRIQKMFSEGKKVPPIEEKFVCLDGKVIDVEVVAMPITYEGKPAIQVIARDITERKKMVDVLKTSEERYRTLIETINTGIFMSTLDGRFIQANSAVVEMAGYDSLDEFLKLPAQDLYDDLDDRKKFTALLQENGFVKNFEVRSVKKDGTRYWISISAVLLRDANGNPTELLGAIADITERKNAEDIIQNSEKRWRTLIEKSADALTLLTAEGTILYEGPTVESLTGFTAEERQGHSATEHIHADDLPMVQQILGNVLNKPGHTETAQFRSKRKDGSLWWIEATATNLLDNPNVQAIVVNYRDITSRKMAEEELRNSEMRFRILFEHAGMGAAQADSMTGKLLRVNRKYCEIVGYSKEELENLTFQEITHPDDLKDDLNKMERLRSGEISEFQMEKRYVRKDGTLVWVVLVVSPLWSPGEAPSTHIAVIHDITEQKRAEYSLRYSEAEVRKLNAELENRVTERTAQLEAANKELEAFAYSVSHDLRAPLRAIDGFSKIFVDGYADQLDEEGKTLIDRVRTANRNMTQLVDALLGLSRMSRAELYYSTIDLSALVHEVATDLQTSSPDRKFSFKIEEGVFAEGDIHLIRAVLENLLGNAWKFTAKMENPVIEFGVTTYENETAYYVRDNGVGFDMAYAGKLFGAFQRLHAVSEFEGTGIGLATVQRIIHRHSGRVWAESEVDKGATFFFTLGKPAI